jgi:hypothetical protein
MKNFLLLSALAAASLLPASCTNSSNAAALTRGNNGEGSLAYTIDGNKNVIKRPASSIYINEVSHNAAKGSVRVRVTIFPSAELFDFIVADKGTTNVLNYQPSFGEEKVVATYLSHAAQNYYGQNVSVTINTVDATHITGTFSGKFVSDEHKSVTVTDGSFDLPMKAKD